VHDKPISPEIVGSSTEIEKLRPETEAPNSARGRQKTPSLVSETVSVPNKPRKTAASSKTKILNAETILAG
jgi:hypothetical protein